MSKQVTVYHTPGCSACRNAMDFLSQHGVSFAAKDISNDAKASEEFSRLKSHSTPTIVVDGQVISGFDQKILEAALK